MPGAFDRLPVRRLDSLLSVYSCTTRWISPGLHFLICEMDIIWVPPHLWLWGFNERCFEYSNWHTHPLIRLNSFSKRLMFTNLPDVEKTLSVFRLGLSFSSNSYLVSFLWLLLLFLLFFPSWYFFLVNFKSLIHHFLYLFSFLRSILLWDQDAMIKFVFHLTYLVFFFSIHSTGHSSEISCF